jgi:hypothetical protein
MHYCCENVKEHFVQGQNSQFCAEFSWSCPNEIYVKFWWSQNLSQARRFHLDMIGWILHKIPRERWDSPLKIIYFCCLLFCFVHKRVISTGMLLTKGYP